LSNAAGVVAKTTYDAAGRVTAQYTTNGASGSGWSNPSSVANDVILAQTEMTNDSNGNAIETITRRRQ
jgi:YD repeat-containing protein